MDILHILFALVGLVGGFGLGWMVFSARLARADVYREEREQARSEKTELHERAVKAEAQLQATERQLKDQQEQLRTEFKNTANTIFENISNKFSTQSEKKIGDLLNPLRERITEFQKKVDDSFGAQGKEQHTLKAEIEKIVLQTDSLTKALRGDVKAQGNWGEIMLERILEESGLRRDIDYSVQANESGAEGNRLRPDVIVRLPDNKHIIIDSKVSLTAYERFCAEANEVAREAHCKEFLRSVKTHISGLEQKRYQDIEKLGTPDFVLLFMPTEGAFSFAIQQDAELHGYAWGKKIIVVSPTTLFATLKTVASLWRIELQNQNAQEIARQGGALYDKFVGFIEDMEAMGKQMARMQDSYDQALGKLHKGRGNLVVGVEKLRQLGAKTSKVLPAIDDEEDELETKPRLSVAKAD